MASIAGYMYCSAEGRYLTHDYGTGLPYVPPVNDTVRVWTIYDNATTVLLGSGTYAAAADYYHPGQAYGYEPPPAQYPRGDPYWDSATSAWYGWVGTGVEYWDLRYGISTPGLVQYAPSPDVLRDYDVEYVTGASLLSLYYDRTGAAGPIPETGKEYCVVLEWLPPGQPFGTVRTVRAVVELTPAFWGGAYPSAGAKLYFAPRFAPLETPPFWTGLVGTRETL